MIRIITATIIVLGGTLILAALIGATIPPPRPF